MDYARASLAVSKSFVVPKPDASNQESIRDFSEAIQRIILEHDVNLVVPAAEEALYVAKLVPEWKIAGSLNRPTHVLTSPFFLLSALHDKYEFQQLCQRAGLASPATVRVESEQQVRAAMASSKAAKFVLKPIYTRGGLSMQVVSKDDSPMRIRISVPHVLQDFVQGQEFSSYSVVANGQVLAHACYSCSYSIKGFSTLRTAERKPAILDWVSRFVASFESFSGQLGFDFIETSEGKIFPLECASCLSHTLTFKCSL